MHLHASIGSKRGTKFIPTDLGRSRARAYVVLVAANRPLCWPPGACMYSCVASFRSQSAWVPQAAQFKPAHLLISAGLSLPISGSQVEPKADKQHSGVHQSSLASGQVIDTCQWRPTCAEIDRCCEAPNWISPGRRQMMNGDNFIKTNCNRSSAAQH